MSGIKVSIVDAHQLSREGLRLLLVGDTYEVINATTSLDAALLEIEGGARPGLLVLVLADSGDSLQSAALQRIQSLAPDCKIVIIANNISSSLLARVTDWGVNALLRSDMSREVL